MPNTAHKFEFTSFQLALDRKSIYFHYKIYFTQGNEDIFEEIIYLPNAIPSAIPDQLLTSILFSLHLMLGISYYKMHCAPKINIKSGYLSKEQAEFWNIVYQKGLGEFFFRNQIDFRNLVHFPFTQDKVAPSVLYERLNKSLLGVGGGKDSLVAYELLQKANKNFSTLVIESSHSYPIIDQLLHHFNLEHIRIKRSLDKKIFEYNKKNTVFNGHIPVSAINAFIGVFVCLIYNYQYFIVSNERSANFGNVEYMGMQINHQWSKSIEFELLFQAYITKFISPSVTYFSLLRPLSEFAIVKLFSAYHSYFSLFSSCNSNYKIEGNPFNEKWCCKCPKCAFVFCMLSAFLPKKTVINIFGSNLYENKNLLMIYRQLWGTQDIKPFECVGTPDEVKIAFYLTYKKKEFVHNPVMETFEKEILPHIKNPEQQMNILLKREDVNSIPVEFRSIIAQLPL